MPSSDNRRRLRFWRPVSPATTGMFRVEHEDRLRTTSSDHFLVVVIYSGAFDGWYRGATQTHVAGAIKLKEPGEIHRDTRVHRPFTLQGVELSPAMVTDAVNSLGLRGSTHFRASAFGPGERATQLAFAMHAAFMRPNAPEIERETRVIEMLREVIAGSPAFRLASASARARRAVRLAREFLHDGMAEKVTLDQLATHSGLDKFHLVRAFRAEVGLPPYAYLTFVRIHTAKTLLQGGARVAEVAQAVGFCDESQLHRHFRRIVGVTPGEFARSFSHPLAATQHRPI